MTLEQGSERWIEICKGECVGKLLCVLGAAYARNWNSNRPELSSFSGCGIRWTTEVVGG